MRHQIADLLEPGRRVALGGQRGHGLAGFGVTGLTAAISGATTLFVVLRDLLEGALAAATVSDLRIAVALLVTAGGLCAYHWTVQRDDRRAESPRATGPRRSVLLVSSDDGRLAEQVAARTGASVRPLRRLDVGPGGGDVEAVSDAILTSPHPRLLVTVDGDGAVQAIPYET